MILVDYYSRFLFAETVPVGKRSDGGENLARLFGWPIAIITVYYVISSMREGRSVRQIGQWVCTERRIRQRGGQRRVCVHVCDRGTLLYRQRYSI